MARILSVNISEEKGTIKHPVEAGMLGKDHGLVGDAHSGGWHRQVSLLAEESVDKVREKAPGVALAPGVFAENLTTEGLSLHTLPLGTRLQAGAAVLEVTQIGKECHLGCEIRRLTGDCVMPREGIFARVIHPAMVRPGDPLRVLPDGGRT